MEQYEVHPRNYLSFKFSIMSQTEALSYFAISAHFLQMKAHPEKYA